MANKEYKMLMSLEAKLGSAFGQTFSSAQKALQNAGADVKRLNDLQRDIAGYQAQQRAAAETERKLADLKTQYDNIQREMQETGTYSSALDNKLVDKQRQIDKTADSLDRQNGKLREMGADLRAAGVDTDHLTAESKRLEAEYDDLIRKETDLGTEGVNAFESIGDALTAIGVATALKEIGEEFLQCVEIAAEFEETMSGVQALSGASATELGALTAEAKELGATTKFTATEAGQAMNYMGMAGWNAEQMLSGMDGVLKLAAASGEDLAMVSDIVTDNLTAFGLTAKDTARFSDVLAAAATNSNTSVSVMGETFKKAAPVAGALGYSVEDVAVAVGLMANAGVKGSRAGTALSNTFTGLLGGVTLTSGAFGEMEINVVNTDGTMMSFGDTIETLRAAFSQMTEAEKVANAEAIAGKQGYAGLLAILNATSGDYDKLTQSINNSAGAAEKMANVRMDNLRGQMTLLQSATDAVKTTIGEAYSGEFKSLAKMATDVMTWINNFMTKHPVLLKSIIAITAEVGLLVGAYTAYVAVKKVKNTLTALETALGVKNAAATVAEKVATDAATASQTKFNLAMLASPAGALALVVGALTVAMIALQHQEEKIREEYESMSPVTRKHAEELESLREEYERVAAAEGERSENALRLKNQVDDLSASYAAEAKSMQELRDEADSFHNAHEQMFASYRDATSEIESEETAALALVQRLEDMAAATDGSAASQGRMQTVIDQLNASLGGLGLTYDELMANPGNATNRVRNYAKSVAERLKTEKDMQRYIELQGMVGEAKANAEAKSAEARAAQDRATAAGEKKFTGFSKFMDWIGLETMTKEVQEYKVALGEAVDATAAAATANKDYNEVLTELNDLEQKYGLTASAVAEGSSDIEGALRAVTTQAQALAEAYDEAYKSALESISGQYNIWDEAAEVSAVSISTINDNLQGQIQYWQDYQANIETLRGYTTEVEGLDVVLASFADGSSDSVNVIAGLANAIKNGDIESVQELVTNYNDLQASQQETADSLAEMTTSYSEKMNELKTQMEQDVAAMDLSDEAKAKGQATIQGFIDGAMLMESKVRSSFASLGQAALAAMNAGKGAGVPVTGYAGGTDFATPGVHLVGEEGPELLWFGGGEKVTSATETRAILHAGGTEISAPISLSINVEGNASAATVSALSDVGNDIVTRVLEALEDRLEDRARRAYV